MTVRRTYAKRAHIGASRRDMYDNGAVFYLASFYIDTDRAALYNILR